MKTSSFVGCEKDTRRSIKATVAVVIATGWAKVFAIGEEESTLGR